MQQQTPPKTKNKKNKKQKKQKQKTNKKNYDVEISSILIAYIRIYTVNMLEIATS